jgi:formate hydrogenlyase transcriptional activator
MSQVQAHSKNDALQSTLESLRQSEALKARLLETSRDCVKILDLDARLLYMNEGGMAVLEICDLGPVIGTSWIEFWNGEDKKAAAAAVEQARRGEVGRFVGYFPTTQTQQPRWWDVVVSAINGTEGHPTRLLAVSRDVTELRRAQRELEQLSIEQTVLLNINQAINRHLNRDELFGALAHALKQIVPTERFGVELPIEGGAKLQGHILSNIAQGLARTQPTVLPATGTACAWVMQQQRPYIAASSADYRERFPVTFQVMSGAGQESLLALPLISGGQSLAALFFMTSEKFAYERLRPEFLNQLANAVAVALDNCLAHERLREEVLAALAASEEKYRDLFEEAPIAYLNEGLDSRFITANRAAIKALGITPEEVAGTYGKTFIPDTPEAQERLKQVFAMIGKGTDTDGIVLELRRKDTGKPLWIRWWTRPAPDGTYTRTMFIDITEQVLMEQEKARLEAQSRYLQEEIQLTHNFEELVGSSAPLKKVLSNVERVARTDSTVLITNETGTGKELIARAIHNLSPRKDRALVKVNCAAIPAGLIESELFGHEKGAFTGALAKRIGRFELADKGTLFLDEIGELPLDVQSKLLRVLQEGEFERVGGAQTLKVHVRVIAATNRDLAQLSKTGHYRPDLYYRLNVFPMHLPPLREREGDLKALTQYFVQKYATDQGKKIERIPERLWAQLQRYPWPGNVRELQHVIERAVILTDGPELAAVDWLDTPSQTQEGARLPTLEQLEHDHILRALEHAGWKVSGAKGAAATLGLKPTTLEARMKKLGIRRDAGA